MNVGDRIQVTITGISHQGYGIGRYENFVVFIPGAMLEEQVEGEIIECKKRMATARLVKIIEPVAQRIEPQCVQSSRCGGCELQHCNYAYQLEAKRRIVQDALTRLGQVEVTDRKSVV